LGSLVHRWRLKAAKTVKVQHNLQATAGSQRHFSLVKVSLWAQCQSQQGRHLANTGLIDGLWLPMRTPVLCNARLRLSPSDQARAGSLNMLPCQIALLTFSMALLPSVFESVSAEECLTTHQQLLEKKVSGRWKELHQKDNQPLSLTITTGQGNGLQFVGKKPDGTTWISGAMSICSSLGNKYQVKLDRIDRLLCLSA
jgi:hypothetical protein